VLLNKVLRPGMSVGKTKQKIRFDGPDFRSLAKPLLIIAVDAEEEFDWTKPFSAESISVDAMRLQEPAQRIIERHGIVPIYICDYAVLSQPAGHEMLKDWHKAGRCAIGAQLHTWVTPPHDETVNEFNSYPCNLPYYLQHEKLRLLTNEIEEKFGERVTVYKAGRNGADRRVVRLLKSLGYKIDLSFNPIRDYRRHKGPDHTIFPHEPFWLDREKEILSIPSTGDVLGILRPLWPGIDSLTWGARSERLHVPGILRRLGLGHRIGLTPEGVSLEDAKSLTRAMFLRGHRVFTVSYHSPSLLPGSTPYVRNQRDLEIFLEWLDGYLEFFTNEMKGQGVTPVELYKLSHVGAVAETHVSNAVCVPNIHGSPGIDSAARSEIAVFDFLSHANMHHAFNEGYIRTLRAAFPDDTIMFYAVRGQIEYLAKKIGDISNVRLVECMPFQVSGGFSRHHAVAGFLAAQKCYRFILDEIRNLKIRFVSLLGVDANLFAVVGQGWPQSSSLPLHMILHGQLGEAMVWRSRNPITRNFDFVRRISGRLPQGARLVALELGVAASIAELSPIIASNIETLEHPILTSEWGHAGLLNGNAPLKIAFLGHTRQAKGFGIFSRLAKSADKKNFEFHAIGLASNDISDLDLRGLHRLPSPDPLLRKTYLDLLAEVDLVCLPLNSRAYEFTASGTVSDAIAALKPLIAIRNPTFEAIVKRYGPIGYLVDSEQDLFSLIKHFNRDEFVRMYPTWIDNLKKARDARNPCILGESYASMLTW
jgi:hypothetical protein